MNKVLSITWKDLIQTVREWKAAFFMLLMPVVFTLFFGIVFDGTEEPSGNIEKGSTQTFLRELVDIEGILAADREVTGANSLTGAADTMNQLLRGRHFTLTSIPVRKPGKQADTQVPGGFTQSSPGMIIQFTIIGLISTSMILLYERKSKTMGRMMASPVRFTGIISGHTLAMFIAVYIQQIILVLIGRLVFKVPYFLNPGPLFVLLFFFALWATSLGVLISTLARKEEQVVTLSIICMFVFSALGGAWFPLEIAGPAFSKIGHILPSAWAMDGLQDIILRGKGYEALPSPLLVFAAYTIAFFLIAVFRLRKLRSSV